MAVGVGARDFYDPHNAAAYNAAIDLHALGEPVDTLTVAAHLTTDNQPAPTGAAWFPHLHALQTGCPARSNVASYARIVKRDGETRHAIAALAEQAAATADALYNGADPATTLDLFGQNMVAAAGPTPPAEYIEIVSREYGVEGRTASTMAGDVARRVTIEQANTLARRVVRDAQLDRDADLATIQPTSAAELLDRPRVPRLTLFGALIADGHNATIVAPWKTGKSTLFDNAMIAAASGGMFLGRFEVDQPRRVVMFNYELHEDDMTDRLAAHGLTGQAAKNIVVVNLRGRHLPLLTPSGRALCVRILTDSGADLWGIDPFGAAYAAAGGEDENNNAEVRRFLIGLDEIKRLAACANLLMPVHTGRRIAIEGDEQGRGATVLEDWPDVRILLTRGKQAQQNDRFLRTEGRAFELPESRLTFNPTTNHLTLAGTDLGVSRLKARTDDDARAVRDVVGQAPGLNVRDLRAALTDHGVVTRTGDQTAAINTARQTGFVHVHDGPRTAVLHYPGPVHVDGQTACEGNPK